MDKRNIIIDTDADFDDLISIMWLNCQPNINIKLISYCGSGWSRPPFGFQNIINILEYIGASNIPIAIGAKLSMSPEYRLPSHVLDLTNNLWGISLPKSSHKISEHSACDEIVRACLESKEPVTIMALSPLTNIAFAYINEPRIKEKIEAIYITGGCPRSVKKIDDSFAGNEQLDLYASRVIYESGIPIISVPNTLSHNFSVYDELMSSFMKNVMSKAQQLAVDLIEQVELKQKKYESKVALYLWDILTTFVFLHPSCCVEKAITVTIDEHSKDRANSIKMSKEGYTIKKIIEVQKEKVYESLYTDFIKYYGKDS